VSRLAAVVAAVLFLASARAPVAPGCTVPVVLLVLGLGVAGLAVLVLLAFWILVGDRTSPPRGRHRLEAT
jgi:protein-S-isoprenylcysteine O-methyltransferase Ste14